MAFPSEHYVTRSSSNNGGPLRVSLAVAAVFLFVYIIMWNHHHHHQQQQHSASVPDSSCQCGCDCGDFDSGVLDLPSDSINGSYADCRTSDPEIKEEVEKDTLALLSEELVLQKLVANETLQRTKSLVAESGIVYSHYKRETEKCIAQMETCEEARERAEAELRVELKATASWERRARELGWSSSK